MKLFVQEHLTLIVMQCLQWVFLGLLLWLSGFTSYGIFLYGLAINVFFLIIYVIYHYYSRRSVYKKMTQQPKNMDHLLEKTNDTPIGKAFDQMVKAHYGLFTEQLMEAENVQKNHLTFIDRWVHQMKTPLSVIELTAQQLDEPESSNLREETERMKNGLQTILYMARMRTIQEDFHIQQVNVEQLIHDVNAENKRFYIRNNIYPYVTMNQEGVRVETDEKWLFFILEQLVQNAVKYSVGTNNRIDVSVGVSNGAAVLSITDYGVGIPLHDQKRVYEAFYTGDNGRTFRESTGMGLYIVREVATYIGHAIEMESTPQVGTTFRIRFTREQTII